MHLDEETMQRLLHDELPAEDERTARHHVERCASCRERLASAGAQERTVTALLTALDHPLPRHDAAIIAQRAARAHWFRRAAGLVLALGAAGAVYAAAAEPIGAALDRLLGRNEPAGTTRGAGATDAGGFGVVAGDSLTIVFREVGAGELRVALDGESVVEVRASGSGASFTSDPDRLTVTSSGAPLDFRVAVPRDARRIVILHGADTLLVKDGPRIRTAADSVMGEYVLTLPPGGH